MAAGRQPGGRGHARLERELRGGCARKTLSAAKLEGRAGKVARILRRGRPDLAPPEARDPQTSRRRPGLELSGLSALIRNRILVPPPPAHSPRAPPPRGPQAPSERSPPRPPRTGPREAVWEHVTAHALSGRSNGRGRTFPAGRAGFLRDRIGPEPRLKNHRDCGSLGDAKMPSKGKDKSKGKGKDKKK